MMSIVLAPRFLAFCDILRHFATSGKEMLAELLGWQ